MTGGKGRLEMRGMAIVTGCDSQKLLVRERVRENWQNQRRDLRQKNKI